MPTLRPLACLAFTLLFVLGCSRSRATEPSRGSGPATPSAGSTVAAPPGAGRSLVVTVDLAVTVPDVDRASTELRARAESAGGYVAEAADRGSSDSRRVELDLRVPVARASDLRAFVAGLGQLTSDAEKSEDVTEERADLEARLGNARVEERRLLEVMQQRTGTIGDVLEAEKEIARVREAIERLDAQKRSMESRIDLATVRVTLTAPDAVPWQTPGASVVAAWQSGAHAAWALAVCVAIVLATVAPGAAPILAAMAATALLVRARRRAAWHGGADPH